MLCSKPAGVPRFWRECGLKATALAGLKYSKQITAQWLLVLESENIPYKLVRHKGLEFLFVPPLYSCKAKGEICAYLKEPPLKPKIKISLAHVNLQPVLLMFLILTMFHALRMGWWGGFGFTPDQWLAKGALSAQQVYLQGEWYRAVTSLTLHADTQHLLGNTIFGGLVLSVLALRIGAINALCLSFFSGVTGNLLSAFIRLGSDYSSIGSSTALFGAMGVLCGLSIAHRDMYGWRRVVLPLAAGFAWLAFLGMEGVQVDVNAHLAGLLTGIGFGLLTPYITKKKKIPFTMTAVMSIASVLLIAFSWKAALVS